MIKWLIKQKMINKPLFILSISLLCSFVIIFAVVVFDIVELFLAKNNQILFSKGLVVINIISISLTIIDLTGIILYLILRKK